MPATPNILVGIETDDEGLERIRRLAAGGIVECIPRIWPGDELPTALISDRTILFAEYLPANYADMRNLEWYQLASAGFDELYEKQLVQNGVRVTTASGIHDVAIAEWCVAMMISLARDLPRQIENQRRHVWEREERYQSELRGTRVGILGYGNIGREVARLCRALGLEVWAMSRGTVGPRRNRASFHERIGDPDGTLPQRTFTSDQLTDFLPHLDYLVLTAPMDSRAEGIIGEPELRLMKPSAVLLNPSRGNLVQEQPLLRALSEGWIAGAAIDTHWQFPMPPEHPLWDMPNVIMTPNVSGVGSTVYLKRIWTLFAENLERYLAGQPLLNELSVRNVAED